MKRLQWLLVAGLTAGGFLLSGCGGDDSISPTPDYAAAWVGTYSGSSHFLFSSGLEGTSDTATLEITALDPKRVIFYLQVPYTDEAGKSAIGTEGVVVTPRDPDLFSAETRIIGLRTAIRLKRTDGHLTGTVYRSSIRGADKEWTLEQQMIIDMVQD